VKGKIKPVTLKAISQLMYALPNIIEKYCSLFSAIFLLFFSKTDNERHKKH